MPDLTRILVIPQSDKTRVTQVIVFRPFGKLDLRHKLRLEPPAFFHRFRGKSDAAPSVLGLGKVGKRALPGFQCRESSSHFTPGLRHETVSNFSDEQQLSRFVVAHQKSIEVIHSGNIAADDELLAFVNTALDPRAAPLAWLIKGISLFGDDSFKSELSRGANDFFRRALKVFREPGRIREGHEDLLQDFASSFQREPQQTFASTGQKVKGIIMDLLGRGLVILQSVERGPAGFVKGDNFPIEQDARGQILQGFARPVSGATATRSTSGPR